LRTKGLIFSRSNYVFRVAFPVVNGREIRNIMLPSTGIANIKASQNNLLFHSRFCLTNNIKAHICNNITKLKMKWKLNEDNSIIAKFMISLSNYIQFAHIKVPTHTHIK
ncbi:MAG: hypothetical protein ABIN24_03185, partial [Dyadobacter sp.]